MNKTVLITGGARSGKSRYALSLGSRFSKKAYIATAQALDSEMLERIKRHRLDRDPSYTTFEVPLELPRALTNLIPNFEFIVIDCLTLWLSNLFLQTEDRNRVQNEIERLIETVRTNSSFLVIVTNEVGMGIVPESAMGRCFRDLQGTVNQELAQGAEEVIFMVSGFPLIVKKEEWIREGYLDERA